MGIFGLPNVGKSSLFNLLTEQSAAAENYPFCTIDPNESTRRLLFFFSLKRNYSILGCLKVDVRFQTLDLIGCVIYGNLLRRYPHTCILRILLDSSRVLQVRNIAFSCISSFCYRFLSVHFHLSN